MEMVLFSTTSHTNNYKENLSLITTQRKKILTNMSITGYSISYHSPKNCIQFAHTHRTEFENLSTFGERERERERIYIYIKISI